MKRRIFRSNEQKNRYLCNTQTYDNNMTTGMTIVELKERKETLENAKLNRRYLRFEEFLKELRKKELPVNIVESVNQDIENINSTPFAGKEFKKLIAQKQANILKLLEKELKIVPKDHYLNLWLALGTTFSGIPIALGTAFGFDAIYLALFGCLVPIGVVVGMVVGKRMDTKALKEGRQLDVKVEF